jgi:hypothetical protein
MACPAARVITAKLTAKCNADQKVVMGELGENFWALAVQHCTDAASEEGCVIMRVEPLQGYPNSTRRNDDRTKCDYEFKATVYCAKTPRSTFDIILDAVRKATGLTLVIGTVILLLPFAAEEELVVGRREAVEALAKVIDGMKKAIEVGAH